MNWQDCNEPLAAKLSFTKTNTNNQTDLLLIPGQIIRDPHQVVHVRGQAEVFSEQHLAEHAVGGGLGFVD
jgi:hypothetical protein